MPTKRTGGSTKSFNNRKMQTKWLANAAKSIGLATNNVFKDVAPNTHEVLASGLQVSKQISTSFMRNRGGINRVTDVLQSNRFVKAADTAYKNILTDIKHGNLAGDDSRMMDAQFGDMGDGFSFGDDGMDGANVNVNYVDTGSSSAILNLGQQIQKSAEANAQMQKASLDAFIAVNAASMTQMGEIGQEIIGQLSGINSSLQAMVQYNNDNMSKFLDSAMAWMEKTGPHMSGEDTKEDPRKAVMVGGKFNMSNYKRLVKKQFGDAIKNSDIGWMADMLDDDMLNMLAANPLGFLSTGMMRMVIPKALTSSAELLEKSFDTMMPQFIDSMAKLGKKEGSKFGDAILRMVGQSLGIDLEEDPTKAKQMSAKVKRDAIPFDGETKHAITQVITKELRDQTTYLRTIAEKMVGKQKVSANQKAYGRYFNYETGAYETGTSAINARIAEELTESIRSGFASTDFGKIMQQMVYEQNTEEKQKEMQHFLDDLYIQLERSGNTELSLNMMMKLLATTGATKKTKEAISAQIEKMNRSNHRAFQSASGGRIASRMNFESALQNIENEYGFYNFLESDFANRKDKNGKDLDVRDVLRNINSKSMSKNKKTKYTSSDKASMRAQTEAPEKFQKFVDHMEETAHTAMERLLAGDLKGMVGAVTNQFTGSIGDITKNLTKKLFGDNTGESGKGRQSIFAGLSDIGTNLKLGTMCTLFGVKGAIAANKDLTDEQKQEAIRMMRAEGYDVQGGGLVGKLGGFLEEGFKGWAKALFGEKEDFERLKKAVKDKLKESVPSMAKGGVAGSALGALAGNSILGALIGGPFGGAILGAANGFLSRNEKFQDWVFGKDVDPDDPSKGKLGGIISRETQKFFKDNKGKLGIGTAIGTVIGAKTGAGLLGMLVGGPLAGAIFGMSGGVLAARGTFDTFLFGNKETNEKSFLQTIATAFKTHSGISEKGDATKSAAMGAVGAGAGALTAALLAKMGLIGASLTPLGPIGGAILGLSAGIAAEGENLTEFLWGKKDGLDLGDGKKKDRLGIFGRLGNQINASLLKPLAAGVGNLIDQMGYDIKHNILAPFTVIGESLAGMAGSITKVIGSEIKKLSSPVMKMIGAVGKGALGFIGSAVSKTADLTWKMFSTTLGLPLKALATILKNPFNSLIGGLMRGAGGVLDFMKLSFIDMPIGVARAGAEKVRDNIGKPIGNALGKANRGIANRLFGRADDYVEGSSIGANLRRIKGNVDENFKKQFEGTVFGDLMGLGEQVVSDRKSQMKADREAIKRRREDRKIEVENAKQIAKLTGGQFSEDTVEARAYIKNLYKEKFADGTDNYFKVLGIKGEAKDRMSGSTAMMSEKSILNTDVSRLDEGGQQVNYLAKIFNFLTGKIDKDGNDTDDNKTENKRFKELSEKEMKAVINEYAKQDQDDAAKNAIPFLDAVDEEDYFGVDPTGGAGNGGRGIITSLLGLGLKGVTGLGKMLFSSAKRGAKAIGKAAKRAGKRSIRHIGGFSSRAMKRFSTAFNAGEDAEDDARASLATGNNTLDDRLNGANDKEGVAARQKQEAENQAKMVEAREKGREVARQRMLDASEAREDDRFSELKDAIGAVGNTVSEHASNWSGIFGGKGLVTLAAIAAFAWAAKNIPGMLGMVSSAASKVVELAAAGGGSLLKALMSAFMPGDTLTNGNTRAEETQRITTEIQNGDVFTDTKGNAVNRTEKMGKVAANLVGNFALGRSFTGKIAHGTAKAVKAVRNLAKGAGRKAVVDAASSVPNAIATTAEKAIPNAMDVLAEANGIVPEAADDVAKVIGKDAVKISKEFAESTAGQSKGLLSKALEGISKFFNFLKDQITEKFGAKTAEKFLEQADDLSEASLKKLAEKNWTKIAPKAEAAAAKETARDAAGASTLGLATLAFIAAGAVNGASGAAKLFHVDRHDADATMILISTIFGAAGTAPGLGFALCVLDVIASFAGWDLLGGLAKILYTVVKTLTGGKEAVQKLEESQEAFHKKWEENVRDPAFENAYNEAMSAGLISKDMDLDTFIAKYEAGELDESINVEYMSENDYNVQQHKSIGDHIISAAAKPFKAIKNAVTGNKANATMSTTNQSVSSISPLNGGTGGRGGGRAGLLGRTAANFVGRARSGIRTINTKIGARLSGQNAEFVVRADMSNPEETMIRQLGAIGELSATAVSLLSRIYYETALTSALTSKNAGIKVMEGAIAGGKTISSMVSSGINNIKNKITSFFGGGGRGETLNGGTYFAQGDSAWGGNAYDSPDGTDLGTMADDGCAPTAMAMAANDMGIATNPMEMAGLAQATGNRDQTGTNWNFIGDAATAMGMGATEALNPSAGYLASQIASGNPVILSGRTGGYGGRGSTPYTDAGHYVYATGIDNNGYVSINDPLGRGRSRKYSLYDLAGETGAAWTLGGGGRGPAGVWDTNAAPVVDNTGLNLNNTGSSVEKEQAAPEDYEPMTIKEATKQNFDPKTIWTNRAGSNGVPQWYNNITKKNYQGSKPKIWEKIGEEAGRPVWYNNYTGERVSDGTTPGTWIKLKDDDGKLVTESGVPIYYNVYTGERRKGGIPDGERMIGESTKSYATMVTEKQYSSLDLWLGIAVAVHNAVAEKCAELGLKESPDNTSSSAYFQGGYVDVEVGGKKLHIRRDCSGYVGACLEAFGVANSQPSSHSYTQNSSFMAQAGFTEHKFTSFDELPPGSILHSSNHVEIWMGDGVISHGSGKGIYRNDRYVPNSVIDYYFVPGEKGDGCVNVVGEAAGTYTGGESGGSANSGSATVVDVGEDNQSPIQKVLSYLGSAFSTLGNRVLSGVHDPDYSYETIMGGGTMLANGAMVGGSSSSGTSSGGSSSSRGSAGVSGDIARSNLQGSTAKEKIWNTLRSKFGLNAIGAAGVMGSWEPESTNDPSRIEGDYAFLKNATEEYKDQIMTDDKVGNEYMNKLFASYRKNGLKINESYYQWPSNSGSGIYKPGVGLYGFTGDRAMHLVQQYGTGWNDLSNQLDYALNGDLEFNHQDSRFNLRNNLNNATSPEEASYVSFDTYKNSTPGYHNRVTQNFLRKNVNEGAAAARSYYNMYKDLEVKDDTGEKSKDGDWKLIGHEANGMPIYYNEKTGERSINGSKTNTTKSGDKKKDSSSTAKATVAGGSMLANGAVVPNTVTTGKGYGGRGYRRGGHGAMGTAVPIVSNSKSSMPTVSDSARKYISSTSSSDLNEMLMNVITILASIAENTGSSSTKLDMLKDLRTGTTTYTFNNGSGGGRGPTVHRTHSGQPTSYMKTTAAQRMQDNTRRSDRIAQKIARGGSV